MPNRIFRDGFVDSEAVTSLSDWAHRVYSNLLVKCDDAGRIDGRLEAIRSHLFPLGTKRRTEDFRQALEELEKVGLTIVYEWKGKSFIQVTKWQRCGSTATSRFPWHDGSHRIEYRSLETRDGLKDFVTTSILDGVPTPCGPPQEGVDCELNTETESETKTKTKTKTKTETGITPLPPVPVVLPFGERFAAAWANYLAHRRELKKPLTGRSEGMAVKKFAALTEAQAVACIEDSIANGWQGLFPEKHGGKPNGRPATKGEQMDAYAARMAATAFGVKP